MDEPTPEIRDEAISLINQLRSGVLADEELSRIAVRLDELLPDPDWFSYTIDHVPELEAADVVERAFKYRPIYL